MEYKIRIAHACGIFGQRGTTAFLMIRRNHHYHQLCVFIIILCYGQVHINQYPKQAQPRVHTETRGDAPMEGGHIRTQDGEDRTGGKKKANRRRKREQRKRVIQSDVIAQLQLCISILDNCANYPRIWVEQFPLCLINKTVGVLNPPFILKLKEKKKKNHIQDVGWLKKP